MTGSAFRGSNAAASLKRRCRLIVERAREAFRGSNAAASLKLAVDLGGDGTVRRLAFRGSNAAASLKLYVDPRQRVGEQAFRGSNAAASLKRTALCRFARKQPCLPRQ